MTQDFDPVIQAAFETFARYGVRKTTMGDIAQAAGISRQTLYNHYSSKDDMLRATIKHVSQAQLATLTARFATSPDLATQIDAFFDEGPLTWFDTICRMPDAAEMIEGMNTVAKPEVTAGAADWRAALTTIFEPHAKALAASGSSPEAVADFLYNSASGAKADIADRAQLVARLATLKTAILLLTGQTAR